MKFTVNIDDLDIKERFKREVGREPTNKEMSRIEEDVDFEIEDYCEDFIYEVVQNVASEAIDEEEE